MGRLHTRYAPVRRSPTISASTDLAAPRLACVKPVASVHPEPGSNSPLFFILFFFFFKIRKAKTYLKSFAFTRPSRIVRPGFYPRTICRLLCFRIDRSRLLCLAQLLALVLLLSIVIVFNVLNFLGHPGFPFAAAKLRTIFGTTKFLFNFLTLFSISRFSAASFPKASAKLHPFSVSSKFFSNFFML